MRIETCYVRRPRRAAEHDCPLRCPSKRTRNHPRTIHDVLTIPGRRPTRAGLLGALVSWEGHQIRSQRRQGQISFVCRAPPALLVYGGAADPWRCLMWVANERRSSTSVDPNATSHSRRSSTPASSSGPRLSASPPARRCLSTRRLTLSGCAIGRSSTTGS